MSAPAVEAAVPVEAQQRRTGVARWIRRLAVPIIIGWIALIAILNVTVPQLEVVGQMRAVSMSPKEAPSVIAMMRSGQLFEESDRITGQAWPRLEAQQRTLRVAMAQFAALSGHVF